MYKRLLVGLVLCTLARVDRVTANNCSATVKSGNAWMIGNRSFNWFQTNITSDQDPAGRRRTGS